MKQLIIKQRASSVNRIIKINDAKILAHGLFPVIILSHYNDVTMSQMASQITSFTIVYSTVYSDADQRKHQSSASLAFVWEIHRGPVNSPHKWPVTWKMFPFDDVIMEMRWITALSDGVGTIWLHWMMNCKSFNSLRPSDANMRL